MSEAMKYNKAELIAFLEEKAGVSPEHADAFLGHFAESITQALANGERVELRGLGVFDAVEMPPRKARNPKTGQELVAPGMTRVKFKASKNPVKHLVAE